MAGKGRDAVSAPPPLVHPWAQHSQHATNGTPWPHPNALRTTTRATRSPQEDGSEADSRSLSRRDAAAFVRAVRRYGRSERLADVASEVGRSLEEASPGQRLSLWHTLMDGCKAAVQRTTEEQKEDAKVGVQGRGWGAA